MKALAIAATGMNAQQSNLEVIANNIANINTTGFKRARAEFTDLLYQVDKMQGVPNQGNQAIIPEGVKFGLGVKLAAIRNVHTQGALTGDRQRARPGLLGNGWFQINGVDGEPFYTRAGSFNTNAHGELVTVHGLQVEPGHRRAGGCAGSHRQQIRPGLRPGAQPGRPVELGQLTSPSSPTMPA
jgi:flagellar basal-body rod protein FlgG